MSLKDQPLSKDIVGLLEGLSTTRSIRRYTPDPVPPDVLRDILFAATRAPSGSNRQPFRFLVLTEGERAREAKALIANCAQRRWEQKREDDQYDKRSGADPDSQKSRMSRTMQTYVDEFSQVPCLILPCMLRYREPHVMEGASVYPAVQNLLLAARALGYGGVITGFHFEAESQLKNLLNIPDDAFIACTVTLGKPQGKHGPVRRLPMSELVFSDSWGDAPTWAVDPPGTTHTRAGPPRSK